MRAVVEKNGEHDLPEVKVLITKGKEDLTIKVENTILFIYSFIYLFMYLFIYLFIY